MVFPMEFDPVCDKIGSKEVETTSDDGRIALVVVVERFEPEGLKLAHSGASRAKLMAGLKLTMAVGVIVPLSASVSGRSPERRCFWRRNRRWFGFGYSLRDHYCSYANLDKKFGWGYYSALIPLRESEIVSVGRGANRSDSTILFRACYAMAASPHACSESGREQHRSGDLKSSFLAQDVGLSGSCGGSALSSDSQPTEPRCDFHPCT